MKCKHMHKDFPDNVKCRECHSPRDSPKYKVVEDTPEPTAKKTLGSGTFNLSDKIWVEQLLIKPKGTECFFLNVKDVKEFIKLLKEEIQKGYSYDWITTKEDLKIYIKENLNKLAGSKLK